MIEMIMRNHMTESDAKEILKNPDISTLMPGVEIINTGDTESREVTMPRFFNFDTPEFNRFVEFVESNIDLTNENEDCETLYEYLVEIFTHLQLLEAVMEMLDMDDDDDELSWKGRLIKKYSSVIIDALMLVSRNPNNPDAKRTFALTLCGSFELNKYYDEFMCEVEPRLKVIPVFITSILTYMNLKKIITDKYASPLVFVMNRVMVMYSRKQDWGIEFNEDDTKLIEEKISAMISMMTHIIEDPKSFDFEKTTLVIDEADILLGNLIRKYDEADILQYNEADILLGNLSHKYDDAVLCQLIRFVV